MIDHNTALTGDDLIQFVNAKLFPYLHDFKQEITEVIAAPDAESAKMRGISNDCFLPRKTHEKNNRSS